MFEKWITKREDLGKAGSEDGVIVLEEEYPGVAKVTIEKKFSSRLQRDIYPVTMGIYGSLVHTAFFESWDDALEYLNSIKLIIQAMENLK